MSLAVVTEGFHFRLALSDSYLWLRCGLSASCSGSLQPCLPNSMYAPSGVVSQNKLFFHKVLLVRYFDTTLRKITSIHCHLLTSVNTHHAI